ncbi:MAG: GNAT family N-acetyltransferase [Rhodospirillales bacterium]|nr:GNAT family N-acetyltransferase [Rhodospirillales bacterium]MDH3791652.1 GNAT family N-acetyltransferase [Rhodospirillales bacterium]MDH3913757.1 GNAT family N-acetyltransferase [Rhodospirillales bacterium]MDH3921003.1 GNAT family N-acetyltransferase [Rhodospirillales bacterium]MDH3965387.1 GNAT family N-acetyltransferase [Rhodospirillales bacterium]
MGVKIRPAEPRDAAAVVAMAAELSANQGKPPRSFSEADFRRDGFGPEAAFSCLIAEVDGAPAGYALFHDSYDAEAGGRGTFVHDLYLRPAFRRSGLGRTLLARVCRATQAAGGRFVWWCMIDGNEAAEGFYRSMSASLDDLRIWIADGENFVRLAGRRPPT